MYIIVVEFLKAKPDIYIFKDYDNALKYYECFGFTRRISLFLNDKLLSSKEINK